MAHSLSYRRAVPYSALPCFVLMLPLAFVGFVATANVPTRASTPTRASDQPAVSAQACQKTRVLLAQGIKRDGEAAIFRMTPLPVTLRPDETIQGAPRTGQVSGRVLDDKGQPLAGARVAVLFPGDLRDLPDTSVLTDDRGQFTMKGLVSGEVVLGAAKGRAFSQVTLKTGQETELKLGAEEAVVPPEAVEVAWAQLEEQTGALKQDDRDRGWGGRGLILLMKAAVRLAHYDAERAQRAITGANGQTNETFLRQATQDLARTHPQLALKWGPIWLAQCTNPDMFALRDEARLSLAISTAALAPEAARATYEELATATSPGSQSMHSVSLYAKLATLASALKNPDAEGWLQALTIALDAQSDDVQESQFAYAARILADGDWPTARRWSASLPLKQRFVALSGLAKAVAPRDSKTARALLAEMQTLLARPDFPRPKPRKRGQLQSYPAFTLDQARQEVATTLMATDLPTAREVADALPTYNGRFMQLRATIAAQLAGANDGEAMRAAIENAGKSQIHPAGDMARLATLVNPALPEVGAQGFAAARLKLAASSRPTANQEEPAAFYAYALAPFDPAQSRLLLENEWWRIRAVLQQLQLKNKPSNEGWRATSVLPELLIGMLPLSLTRTNEILRELGGLNRNMTLDYEMGLLQQQVINWLLNTDQARRTLAFESDTLVREAFVFVN